MKTLLLIVCWVTFTLLNSLAQHAPVQHYGVSEWEAYDSDTDEYSNLYLDEVTTLEIDGYCVPQQILWSQFDPEDWELWEPYAISYYFYSDDLYLDSIHFHDVYSNGNESSSYTRTVNQYDENNLVILEEKAVFNTVSFIPQQLVSSSYNAELLVDTTISQYWDTEDQVYVNSSRKSWMYNDENLKEEVFAEYFLDGEWVPDRREVFVYTSENLLDTMYRYEYNVQSEEYLERIIVYTYDTDGVLIGREDFGWDSDLQEFDLNWGYTFDYYEDGLLKAEYEWAAPWWGEQQEWGIINRTSYSGYCGQVSVSENDDANMLEIFPNPSQGILTIRNNHAPISEIYITDNLGRKVYTIGSIQGTQTLDLDLPGGTYLIHSKGTKGNVVQKFIIE